VSNVKSDLLFALRRLGLLARGSYLAPFAPEWQALWRRLPDQYARTTLSRFFRYCSAQGVQPVLVTDEVAASFLTALETETLVKQPRVVHQNVARLWNRMRAQVPGWPTVELTVPGYAPFDPDALLGRLRSLAAPSGRAQAGAASCSATETRKQNSTRNVSF
jgi:hypothetical protein